MKMMLPSVTVPAIITLQYLAVYTIMVSTFLFKENHLNASAYCTVLTIAVVMPLHFGIIMSEFSVSDLL